MRNVALDLGVKKTTYCEVSASVVVKRSTVGDVESLRPLLGPDQSPARVAIEACREAWHVHDLLVSLGNEVLMVDTTLEDDYFDRPAAWGAHLVAAVERRADATRVGAMWKRPNDVVFLVSRAPEHVINLNTDGESLVWVQARADVNPDQTHPGASVWRSPFVTSAAELTPAKVRDIDDVPSWVVSQVGAGYYALQGSAASHIDVIRLSDGGRRRAPPPAAWDIAEPDFVDAEFVFYTARAKATAATSGFVRQSHRALEPED